MEYQPIIFQDPPIIHATIGGVALYKLLAKEYNNRIKQLGSLFIEIVATLLIVGLLWITVDWVKITVTIIALLLAFILLLLMSKVI